MTASMRAAEGIIKSLRNQSLPYLARQIRRRGDHFIQHSELPVSKQGRHMKTRSYIQDKDVQESCRTY